MAEVDTITVDGAGDSGPEVLSGEAQPTPEEALAQAARVVEEKDRRIVEAEQRARQADETAKRAAAEVARANAGRVHDRAAAVASAAEAAKSDVERAMTAVKMAREAGDTDAELRALRDFNQADYRFNQASAELHSLKITGDAGGQPAAQAASSVSPEAQSWIDQNPRFNSDRAFRTAMIYEHQRLVDDGVTANSPAYFRALDEAAKAHGGDMEQGKRAPASSSGAPSRAGGSGSGEGGGSRVNTMLGAVNVTRGGDGKVRIAIPPHLRETFEEGAKIAGMKLADYAYDQVQIAREREAGGNGGLITGEGRDYR